MAASSHTPTGDSGGGGGGTSLVLPGLVEMVDTEVLGGEGLLVDATDFSATSSGAGLELAERLFSVGCPSSLTMAGCGGDILTSLLEVGGFIPSREQQTHCIAVDVKAGSSTTREETGAVSVCP